MSIAGVHQHRWSPPAFPAGCPRHACVIALSWEEAELREEMIRKQRTTGDAPDSPAPHETGSLPHLIRRALAGLTSPCRAAATHIPSGAGLEQPRLLGQLWTLTGALLTPSLCANHTLREAPTPGAEAAGGSVRGTQAPEDWMISSVLFLRDRTVPSYLGGGCSRGRGAPCAVS